MLPISLGMVLVLLVAPELSQATLFKRMTIESLTLPFPVYRVTVKEGKIQCASLCQADGMKCQVYIFNKVTGICKLVNTSQQQQPQSLMLQKDDMVYYNYGL